jgi:hypothetical protein
MSEEQEPGRLLKTWNEVAGHIIAASKAWKVHLAALRDASNEEIENESVELQEYLTRLFSYSDFDMMLPQLVQYWMVNGGVETILVRLPVEEGGEVKAPKDPKDFEEQFNGVMERLNGKENKNNG